MQEVKIPWGKWYQNGFMKLTFPNEWSVSLNTMQHISALTTGQLEEKIDSPIGTPTLEELSKGKNSACIVIDDISRPTPGWFVLPIIINKLIKAGIDINHIKVLLALGAHRPMVRADMIKKVGDYVLDTVEVLNHNPFSSDLVSIDGSGINQFIKINQTYAQSDLKILVGCIVPHTLAGFSGGAKNVIPGIAGIDTLESNHKMIFRDPLKSKAFSSNTLNPDNPTRKNMEAIAQVSGVDFIVNVVMNDELQVANAFSGHYIDAHREACECAILYYRTKLEKHADIVILNAYPKDTEYSQIGTAFSVLGQNKSICFNKKSTLILTTAASEGAGYHALFGPGMRLFVPHDDNTPPPEIKHVDTLIYSTGVKTKDIASYYSGSPLPVLNNWETILSKLMATYRLAKVAIYPLASMQIGYLEDD
jgi:nickel-dependent lactate racemase